MRVKGARISRTHLFILLQNFYKLPNVANKNIIPKYYRCCISYWLQRREWKWGAGDVKETLGEDINRKKMRERKE